MDKSEAVDWKKNRSSRIELLQNERKPLKNGRVHQAKMLGLLVIDAHRSEASGAVLNQQDGQQDLFSQSIGSYSAPGPRKGGRTAH